jgi:Ni/Fe-hydrogenase subunit HybB-like protein
MTAFLYLFNFLTKGYFSYSPEGLELNSLMSIGFTAIEVGAVFVFARILKLLMIRFFYKK